MNTVFHTETLQTKEKLPTRQVFGYLSGMAPTILIVGFFGFAYSKFFLNDLKLDPKGDSRSIPLVQKLWECLGKELASNLA
jgi:hypothetical protein